MAVAIMPSNKPADLQRRGTTTATLIIPARTAHRRTLIDWFIKGGNPDDYSEVKVGNVTVCRLYHALTYAKLIQDLSKTVRGKGFLSYMSEIIPDFPFPTASEDEDITITASATPTRIDAHFRDTEEGDVVSKTVKGGSQSPRQFFVINLSNASEQSESKTGAGFDSLDMPTGLTCFSGGVTADGEARMAAAQRFTLYAIAANWEELEDGYVDRIHIFDEKIELFCSENNEGLYVNELNGSELACDITTETIFKLPTPYVFEPNRLLTFKYDFTYSATSLPAHGLRLFLIGTREFIV
jgi:hypothetical protein